jgi:hypothetical protein
MAKVMNNLAIRKFLNAGIVSTNLEGDTFVIKSLFRGKCNYKKLRLLENLCIYKFWAIGNGQISNRQWTMGKLAIGNGQ